jgi:hypothetical protein
MSHSHAVVRIDHQQAMVLHFDADHLEAQKVKAHSDHTRQHGSGVRTEHEFFGHVCDALVGTAKILATGPHTAQADFRHYLATHRPALSPFIVRWETVDHPTEGQLVALARQYFLQHDRRVGTSTLS